MPTIKEAKDWFRKVLEDYTETSEAANQRRQEHKKTTCPSDTHMTWYEQREKQKKSRDPLGTAGFGTSD
jgi:hypothetical protein